MNLRKAILKAADHIEANPELFKFSRCLVPECGSPGCAIGWIGHFAGPSCINKDVGTVAEELLGLGQEAFYSRMDSLSNGWISRPTICAQALRKYAARYHPEELPSIQSELARISALPSAQVRVAA